MKWPDLTFPPINLYNCPRTDEITPCKRLCKLVDDECLGCGRTLEQIRNWKDYDVQKKLEITHGKTD